jgi:hypothetical protein
MGATTMMLVLGETRRVCAGGALRASAVPVLWATLVVLGLSAGPASANGCSEANPHGDGISLAVICRPDPGHKAAGKTVTHPETGSGIPSLAEVITTNSSAPTSAPLPGLSWGAPASFDSGGKVTSVSCPSASYCVAVGGNGTIMSYNGVAWSTALTSDDDLTSVSCTSDSYCAAVGYNSAGNIFSYHGGSWSAPQPLDTDHKLHSISCATTTFCEVGAAVNVFTVDGTSEAGDTIDAGNNGTEAGYGLPSMSCTSATFCATIDGLGNAFILNGSVWSTPESIDSTVQLDSVSCVSVGFCVAVDSKGNAFTYNGAGWSAPQDIDANTALESVSCPSTGFCVAIDANGDALTFNGTAWSAPSSIDPGQRLAAVSCPTTSYCMAVDAHGNYVVARVPPPGAPACANVSVSVPKGGKAVSVPLSCVGPAGVPESYSIVLPPADGNLGTIDQATGQVVYTPNPGYGGTDQFTYQATGLDGASNTATATITIPALGRLNPTMDWTFVVSPTYTVVRSLVVYGVPAAAKVELSCTPSSCPIRAHNESVTGRRVCTGKGKDRKCRTIPPGKASTVNLTRLVAGPRLSVGTLLTVKVVEPDTIGKQYTFKIRANRQPSNTVTYPVASIT